MTDPARLKIIELDAAGWRNALDVIHAFKSALGSPEGHGTSIDAFVDSMVYGGMNALEAPYRIVVRNHSHLSGEALEFVAVLSWSVQAQLSSGAPLEPNSVSIVPD